MNLRLVFPCLLGAPSLNRAVWSPSQICWVDLGTWWNLQITLYVCRNLVWYPCLLPVWWKIVAPPHLHLLHWSDEAGTELLGPQTSRLLLWSIAHLVTTIKHSSTLIGILYSLFFFPHTHITLSPSFFTHSPTEFNFVSLPQGFNWFLPPRISHYMYHPRLYFSGYPQDFISS